MTDPSPNPAIPPGWTPLGAVHLPQPSVWPATVSMGCTLLVWGLVASLVLIIFGLIVFACGITGWVFQMLHERKHTH